MINIDNLTLIFRMTRNSPAHVLNWVSQCVSFAMHETAGSQETRHETFVNGEVRYTTIYLMDSRYSFATREWGQSVSLESEGAMSINAEFFTHLDEWTDYDNKIMAELPWEKALEYAHNALREWIGIAGASVQKVGELETQSAAYLNRLREVLVTGQRPSVDQIQWRSDNLNSHGTAREMRWIILGSMADALFDQGLPAEQLQECIRTIIKRAAYDEMAEDGNQFARLAFQDAVTGLPNRLATERYVETLLEHGKSFVVFYLDMDGFKMVNDTYGHAAGDQVLRAVADRWKNLLRRTDWIGRWGGDEFLMVIPHTLSSDAILRFAVRIRQTSEDAITLGRFGGVNVSVSCGYACFPEEGDSWEKVLDCADRRLYRAKLSGLSAVPDIGDFGDWRQRIEEALKESRIEVHYQPIVRSKGATAEQWEALARYRDTDGQLRLPTEFLASLAPDAVAMLDRAVMRQVFLDVTRWKQKGRRVRVSINIDPWDLLSEGWADQLAALHEEFTEVHPEDISFEIRESLTPFGIRRVVESLVYLSRSGYQVALDDFGSGMSSLNRLQELPISTIKIDASLIKNWEEDQGRILIQSVIGLSGPMGFRVVAEGIENSSQRDALASWGCDTGQGWFYGAAMPADDVLTWAGVPAGEVAEDSKTNVSPGDDA